MTNAPPGTPSYSDDESEVTEKGATTPYSSPETLWNRSDTLYPRGVLSISAPMDAHSRQTAPRTLTRSNTLHRFPRGNDPNSECPASAQPRRHPSPIPITSPPLPALQARPALPVRRPRGGKPSQRHARCKQRSGPYAHRLLLAAEFLRSPLIRPLQSLPPP